MGEVRPGQPEVVDHSAHMEIVHWIGVVLALPASAVVLTACWRWNRSTEQPKEPRYDAW
jgi:hypothetical protein